MIITSSSDSGGDLYKEMYMNTIDVRRAIMTAGSAKRLRNIAMRTYEVNPANIYPRNLLARSFTAALSESKAI